MLALLAYSAGNKRTIGIEHDHASGFIGYRWLQPAHGEVERLPQEHGEVGSAHHLGECADRCVGYAARALEHHGGNTRRLLELGEQCATLGVRQVWTGEDQGAHRRVQCREHGIGDTLVQRDAEPPFRFGPRDEIAANGLIQQVRGKAQVDRTRPPRARHVDRATYVLRKRGGRAGHPGSLGDGRRHRRLVELLEAPTAELPGGGVTGQEQHRALGTERSE